MSFTGTPTVTPLGKNKYRITGLSLASTTSGTIGKAGTDVVLPAACPDLHVDKTKISANFVSGAPQLLNIAKAGSPVVVTITNPAGSATGNMEIYVENEHSLTA